MLRYRVLRQALSGNRNPDEWESPVGRPFVAGVYPRGHIATLWLSTVFWSGNHLQRMSFMARLPATFLRKPWLRRSLFQHQQFDVVGEFEIRPQVWQTEICEWWNVGLWPANS